MIWLLYLLIAFAATLFGAVTGMGGGVFIKPILDFWGRQDAVSVSVLSSATVFVMSGITLFRGRKAQTRPDADVALPLSVGAAIGGVLGERLFNALVGNASPAAVKITQNGILVGLVTLTFLYMLFKETVPSLTLKGMGVSFSVGAALGLTSAFLGIGGGPFNVAVIALLFAFSTKTAMQCSLLTILFSQGAKLAMAFAFGGIADYDLSALPMMLAGGAIGGFVGGSLNKRLSERSSNYLFCAAQIIVVCVCAANIIKT